MQTAAELTMLIDEGNVKLMRQEANLVGAVDGLLRSQASHMMLTAQSPI